MASRRRPSRISKDFAADDPLYADATSFLPHPVHDTPICRCVLLSAVHEVPCGVVTRDMLARPKSRLAAIRLLEALAVAAGMFAGGVPSVCWWKRHTNSKPDKQKDDVFLVILSWCTERAISKNQGNLNEDSQVTKVSEEDQQRRFRFSPLACVFLMSYCIKIVK